jgi:hypothetical protein
VGKSGAGGIYRVGMVRFQLGDCGGVTSPNGAEQILGLVLELIEIGTDRQAADGHDEPP